MESTLTFNTEAPEERITLFADVILPLALPRLYTYRIPYELNNAIKVGARVIVQFGKKKILTAIVSKIHTDAPSIYTAKYIIELLDEEPLLNTFQLQLYQWMAEYYMCSLGEVMNAALPSGLKLTSESKIQLNPDFNREDLLFSEKEELIINVLKSKDSLTYDEVAVILGQKSINLIIKSLLAKEKIILYEEVKEKYIPKKIKKIRLANQFESKAKLQELFNLLEKKPKQTEVVLKYLQQVPVFTNAELNQNGLDKSSFVKILESPSALDTLVKNRIFEEFNIQISRFGEEDMTKVIGEVHLTNAQQEAKQQTLELFKTKEVVLLHGITGSGKTEVFIELIKNAMEGGSQVLYLLPEIALTTQIVARLQKVFGDKMGVYHSKFSDNERVDVWKGIMSGRFSFIVGVRSSVFLPFDNLGLIIIDEEHETSYKQYDPAPRYHARDTSILLAKLHNAKTILGSATPSIESYYNANSGKWGMVKMTSRFGNAQLPEIILVDTRRARKLKIMRNDFSEDLIFELKNCLQRKEQAILFQNRRGYAPYLSCEACAHIPKCENCSVSLTFHMHTNDLHCHYCGHFEKVPATCPACGLAKIKAVGFGTEKLEDDIKLFLPEANVQRMDLDTTRKKNSYQKILSEFESGKTNILVGTQMISKGLDFDKVSLVGIFDADRMIHFPDFRSYERSFQMLTQVSGRAGRREKTGKVIIQTSDTEQSILQKVIKNDYDGLYREEILEREKFHYPPFTRMIKVTFKDPEKTKAEKGAGELAAALTRELGSKRILGPEAPVIDRIRNYFLMDIFIKLERDKINLKAVKDIIMRVNQEFLLEKEYKSSWIVVDVDPV
jgi:primosomal protein N' (replication factor Y) (superfamily II helicase)